MAYQIAQMLWEMMRRLVRQVTSFFWISEPSSTVELGKFTGTSKKPPLAPKRRKKRIPVVMYIDNEYWDARMTDAD